MSHLVFFRIILLIIFSFLPVQKSLGMIKLYTCTFKWEGHKQGYKFQDLCKVHPQYLKKHTFKRYARGGGWETAEYRSPCDRHGR